MPHLITGETDFVVDPGACHRPPCVCNGAQGNVFVCPHVVAGNGEMQIQALTCEMFTQA